jgi:H+-transporting ATPase
LIAVLGTQAIATLFAIYGFGVMTPIGWGWAGFVWAYALIWALCTDPIKLLAYRIFDPAPKPATPGAPRSARATPAALPT